MGPWGKWGRLGWACLNRARPHYPPTGDWLPFRSVFHGWASIRSGAPKGGYLQRLSKFYAFSVWFDSLGSRERLSQIVRRGLFECFERVFAGSVERV